MTPNPARLRSLAPDALGRPAAPALDATPRNPGIQPGHPASLEKISESWGDSTSLFPTSWLLVALGAALALTALAAWLRHRKKRRDAPPPPAAAWKRLALHVGLSLPQRHLLARVARADRLPSPLTLMTCPATFDHHARRYLERHDPDKARLLDDRLQDVRDRLFAPTPPAARSVA